MKATFRGWLEAQGELTRVRREVDARHLSALAAQAIAFRVQAGRDVIVVPGARGKHLDPSVRAWDLAPGELPVTDKLGIDATVPEGVPRAKYERMRYPYADTIRLRDLLEGA
jgi:3-polyprenyl-4-hydroxybenzoate decarboxylase